MSILHTLISDTYRSRIPLLTHFDYHFRTNICCITSDFAVGECVNIVCYSRGFIAVKWSEHSGIYWTFVTQTLTGDGARPHILFNLSLLFIKVSFLLLYSRRFILIFMGEAVSIMSTSCVTLTLSENLQCLSGLVWVKNDLLSLCFRFQSLWVENLACERAEDTYSLKHRPLVTLCQQTYRRSHPAFSGRA